MTIAIVLIQVPPGPLPFPGSEAAPKKTPKMGRWVQEEDGAYVRGSE